MGCTNSTQVSLPEVMHEHLQTNAPHLYSLIQEFDNYICLYCDEGVRLRAIQRYETLWLPLILSIQDDNERLSLVPPIDIYFVWYCHMLAPNDYMDDIEKLADTLQEQAPQQGNLDLNGGDTDTTSTSARSNKSSKSSSNTTIIKYIKRLDHKLMNKIERERGKELARRRWIKRYGKQIPFELNLDEDNHRLMEKFAIQQGVALTNHTHLTGGIVNGVIGGSSNNNSNNNNNNSPSHSPKFTNSYLSNSLNDNSEKKSTMFQDTVSVNNGSTVNGDGTEIGDIVPYVNTVITHSDSMNIHTIMQNQLLIHYQFQLPHYYQDETFLLQAIDRYLYIYLDLVRLEPMKIWLPTFDMQFIWYVHLIASPMLYIEHCRKQLDCILSLTHLNEQLYNIQERFDSWSRMNDIISKRKLLSIHIDGGMYRGDPLTNRLSNLLLQRSIKEYEGFYPKEVKIVGSFGRGWHAKIDRIHLSITPLSPPCPPTTMIRRFQNMDTEDKIEEDRLYEEADMLIPIAKRVLHRLNLASRPRMKRLCIITGGLRVSIILTTEGICMEFHLKNDLIATVHSLQCGQYRHSCFDNYCIHCMNSSTNRGIIGESGVIVGGETGNNVNNQNSDSEKVDSSNGVGTGVGECQVYLLRIAGIDQALIHGAWCNNTTSNNSGGTGNIGTNTTTSSSDPNATTQSNTTGVSSSDGGGGVGSGFGLDGLNLNNLVGDTPTLPAYTTSPNVTSYPQIAIYNLPFQEMRIVNVTPSSGTTGKRQLHAYQFKSVCRLLGYDNVEDNIMIDLAQGFIQGERNAPPVVTIALGMTIALMHITLRPDEYCPIVDSINPFLLALGGMLPGDEAMKVPFPSFAALMKSNQ